MAKLYNLAGMSTATTGTGTITLGSAMYGHLTFAQAGAADGDTVTYAIKDGEASEIGSGVYTASGTTLTRTVLKSTNSNAAINLSGAAEVFITAAAEDIIPRLSSTTDNTVPRHDGTAGLLQASGVAIDDSNNVTGVAGLTLSGVLSADDSTSVSAPVYTFDGDTNTGISHPAADTVSISTGGAEQVRVTSAGAVGIGNISPSNKLDVAGTIGATGVHIGSGPIYSEKITAYGNTDAPVYTLVRNDSAGSSAYAGCYFNAYGNSWAFRIGSYAANANKFVFTTDILGAQTNQMELSTAGALRLNAFGAGTLSTDSSGNVTASSDEALKEEIAPFARGLAEIIGIDPISYNWNALSGLDRMSRYHGFSAQNVEAAIPEAVGVGADGYLTLQDRPIIAALVNAVKELAGGVQFDYEGHTFSAGRAEKDRAALLITVAQTSVIQGAQAGDFRWFDAAYDFAIADSNGAPVKMDAVSAFAYCNALLRAII